MNYLTLLTYFLTLLCRVPETDVAEAGAAPDRACSWTHCSCTGRSDV